MSIIKLTGIDPALANFGFAEAAYDLEASRLIIQRLTLVSTELTKVKQVRKNSDDLARADILTRALRVHTTGAALAIAEVPVGSQSARAMASYGICIGVLAGCPVPLIQVTPYEVKLVACGHRQASKEEMIEWGMARYPHLNWLTRMSKGKKVPTNANEHLADACAALEAGIQTDQFQQAVALMRSMKVAA